MVLTTEQVQCLPCIRYVEREKTAVTFSWILLCANGINYDYEKPKSIISLIEIVMKNLLIEKLNALQEKFHQIIGSQ